MNVFHTTETQHATHAKARLTQRFISLTCNENEAVRLRALNEDRQRHGDNSGRQMSNRVTQPLIRLLNRGDGNNGVEIF